VHVLADGDRRRGEGGVGAGLVAGLPGEDVVVVIACAVGATGLAGEVVAQHRGAGLERFVGVEHHGQLFVLDDHRLHGVGGDVAVVGDHDGHFLHLEVHLLVGQHGGHVAGEGGHPVQLQRLQVVGGQHRVHAGNGERGGLVDALDAGMCERAAHDVHVQHAGQLHVVDVVALALDEAGVFLAQAAVAHALQGVGAGLEFEDLRVDGCVHGVRLREVRRQRLALRARRQVPATWQRRTAPP